AHPRPADIAAERRILGALLLGRATVADVAELTAADFDGPGHSMLFAVIVSALELTPDAVPGPALRRLLLRRARAVLRRFPDSEAASAALDNLPWPAACPRKAIAVVKALADWLRRQ